MHAGTTTTPKGVPNACILQYSIAWWWWCMYSDTQNKERHCYLLCPTRPSKFGWTS